MKKMKQLILLGAMILAAFALTGCGTTTINLNDYVSIVEDGYDTAGVANYVFDYEKFEEDYDGKIKKDGKDVAVETFLEKCVNMSLSANSGLSNGDTVTLVWDCNDERASENYGCKLKYSDITYKITELDVPEKFNPFDYASAKFNGKAPNGTATMQKDTSCEEMRWVEFKIDKSKELKNGDVITVTASIAQGDAAFAEKFGKVLGETTKQFTVSGLDEYYLSMEDVPEAAFELLKQSGSETVKKSTEKWENPSRLQDISYVGYIYGVNEKTPSRNTVRLIYKVTANNPNVEYYYYISFGGVHYKGDGTWGMNGKHACNESFWKGNHMYYGWEDLNALCDGLERAYGKEHTLTTNIKR